MFAWSTQPVVNPDDGPSLWGPAWVQVVGYLLVLAGTAWGGFLIVLLVLGVTHFRIAMPARARWLLSWTVLVAAGIMLEALYFVGLPFTKSDRGYVGEVTVRWEYLWLTAGFLVVGAAMLGILTAAARLAAHRMS